MHLVCVIIMYIVSLSPSDLSFFWHYIFVNRRTSASLRSCANAEGYRELSLVFIESKPLIQQLGHALYFAARRPAVAQFTNA